MVRKCERCGYEIYPSYVLTQEEYNEILCPNCGRELVVTRISQVLTDIIMVMVASLIILFPLRLIVIAIIECVWLIVSNLILPVFLYEYTEKES